MSAAAECAPSDTAAQLLLARAERGPIGRSTSVRLDMPASRPRRSGKPTAPEQAPSDKGDRWAQFEDLTPIEVGRRLLAEFAGTLALTAVAAGTEMAAALAPGQVDHVARAIAPGLLVMSFIYALGDASGAHFNPAVTLAFTLKGLFPPIWVPLYWGAQLAGASVAALLLRQILGDVADLGASTPRIAAGSAVAVEVLLTWILVTVILGTADRHSLIGTEAAIAVGATISLCGLFAGTLSGASMNPARSLGPALVSGALGDAWIFVVGPAVGAAIAVVVTILLHGFGPRDKQQVEAAQGE
jgi:aquaporin Z